MLLTIQMRILKKKKPAGSHMCCDPSTQETELGGLGQQDQPGLHDTTWKHKTQKSTLVFKHGGYILECDGNQL